MHTNFFIKVCLKDGHSNYENLPPLIARRKLCPHTGLHFPDFPTSKCASPYLNYIRSTNSATLSKQFTKTGLFQNSFFPFYNIKLYVHFSHCHILSRQNLLFVVITVIYLFNNFCASCVLECVLFFVYHLFFLWILDLYQLACFF